MNVKMPTKRRDPHYFLPTTDGRHLLLGSDADATKAQFLKFFSAQDWAANCQMQARLLAVAVVDRRGFFYSARAGAAAASKLDHWTNTA